MQAPHKFSASKFMGRNLHSWAREGVEVKKEAVKRHIYQLDVVKYAFPYLSIRVKVSSGTYVRTLFADISNYLGTLGSLIALVRESVGHVSTKTAIHMKDWPKDKTPEIMDLAVRIDKVLDFSKIELTDDQVRAFQCGAFMKPNQIKLIHESILSTDHFWILNKEGELVGLSYKYSETEIRPKINFHLEGQA
jgi:tRNA pseudouridine55 synthase